MPPPFTHLHVASGYSLRHGASTPAALVAAAKAHGQEALALTDRDGLYGAVKFARACVGEGLVPILGVDLAVEPPVLSGPPRPRAAARAVPVRGGAGVDPRHPRVTVLAMAADPAAGRPAGTGWSGLCRLVTATHLRGERGRPVSTAELVSGHARSDDGGTACTVLLGPDSDVGRAVLSRRTDLALALLDSWRQALPADGLAVEVVFHRGPEGVPASLGHAARMLTLARNAGVLAVLSNAVRHAHRDDAVTVDVLDAARRLVALDARHLDRTTTEGYLTSSAEMADRADRVATAAGDPDAAAELLERTAALAEACRLDPEQELGLGTVHLPEPHVLGLDDGTDANALLALRCQAGIGSRYPGAGPAKLAKVEERLRIELGMIAAIGIPTYFITVADVCDLIRGMGVRVAARGSGAGSLVNHLLGISGVDPLEYGLLMERFVSVRRTQLPDIDLDVESARRTEVYEEIIKAFGADRVTCVSMMDTYRVRHAIRDVGAALGLPPAEVGTIATSFPHIRARDVRHAIAELPELRASGLAAPRLDLLFDLVERLDGLPRHVALHPCGVVLSDAELLRRTPVEASWMGFPMSQFDKDDVEAMGLLKLDVLGIRMQSAMSYAVDEIARVEGADAAAAGGHPPGAGYLGPVGRIDLDAVPLDDPATFSLIQTARTLGCFQIESPGQRELVGKFSPETFEDLIIDISLFRPGPVKSDMVAPFLLARQGWTDPDYLHKDLIGALENTRGVVVFHEQVLQIVAAIAGCTLEEADEFRRSMGSPEGQEYSRGWFRTMATRDGHDEATIERIWLVLKAFASFGFCKAHAAAFALPTFQSAWLKAHHPAAFLAGVLTHDPGMYPKRLILDDARNLGITVLPLDVNASGDTYRVERLDPALPAVLRELPGAPGVPDGSPYGIRLSLAEVKGISEAEVARIIANRPFGSLADFWHRARVSRPVVERLVVAGGFDSLYGLGGTLPLHRRDLVNHRDLLLQVAELDRWTRSIRPRGRAVPGLAGKFGGGAVGSGAQEVTAGGTVAAQEVTAGAVAAQEIAAGAVATVGDGGGVRVAAARQSQAARPVVPPAEQPVQLAIDLGDAPDETVRSGLPDMTDAERIRFELDVLGLDASRHVLDFYTPLLDELGVTRARDVLSRRSRAELLVAGVKVATQTPPIRSGRRVVFLTLDDTTGPVDATFFEDAQGPYASTVFHSWLLVVRGVLRRTGPRGVSLRATGAWDLPPLWDAWTAGGMPAVQAILSGRGGWEQAVGRPARPALARPPVTVFGGGFEITPAGDREAELVQVSGEGDWEAQAGLPVGDRLRPPAAAAGSDASRPPAAGSAVPGPGAPQDRGRPAWLDEPGRSGGMGGSARHRRVLVHPSGYRQSPYADLKTPGEDTRNTRRMVAVEEAADHDAEARRRRDPPRKLWHASPGSSGR